MQKDFTALGIRQELSTILAENGITEPTDIQAQAIPVLLSGKDVVGQSQTGTGKTLAFVLPILDKIEVNKPVVQGVIITPTRELALQVTREVAKLADTLGIRVLSIYGGQDVDRQIKKLKGGAQIVIATPGRLMDHLRRKTIQLSGVTKLVLDEADQMLHMGFLEDVEALIRATSPKRQMMLFSATMPSLIRGLAERYMRKPVDIRIQKANITLDEIKQVMIEVPETEKIAKLGHLIDEYRPYLAIVFCHTKQRAMMVNMALARQGYETDELHGELSQTKREQVMKRFREAKIQILVATDIAARGLDVEGVTHIFNYDIPRDTDSYIHRIGRTGRAGQTGMAITLIDPHEQPYVRLIEQGIRAAIEKHKISGSNVVSMDKRRIFQVNKEERKQDAGKSRKPAFTFGKTDKKKTESHSGTNLRSRRKTKADENDSRRFQEKKGKRKGN